MLTVGELVSELGLKLVAGADDAGRGIRWVHISELEDPTPWLSGDELLLTTGIQLDTAARQRRFVRLLSDHGVAGLGLGTGFDHDSVPRAMVTEAEKRGLLNLRRTPEALAQLTTKSSRAVLTKLGILTKAEIDSRYHVKMERYIKDMLIELHTMGQVVDTMILPACYSYHGMLADAAAKAKTAGISSIPQVAAANEVGALIEQLRDRRVAMAKVIETAEHKHDDVEGCGRLLTSDGADRMAELRETCDALELMVGDEFWPLPKYREILFPV